MPAILFPILVVGGFIAKVCASYGVPHAENVAWIAWLLASVVYFVPH